MSISAAFDYLLGKVDGGMDFWAAYYATKDKYPGIQHLSLVAMYEIKRGRI